MAKTDSSKPKVLSTETVNEPGVGSVTYTVYDRSGDSKVRAMDTHGHCGWGKNEKKALASLKTDRENCDRRTFKPVVPRGEGEILQGTRIEGNAPGTQRSSRPKLSD